MKNKLLSILYTDRKVFRHLKGLCLSCCLLLSGHILQAQTIWFVNASATGANNGSSWDNAFTDLQGALLAATSGDEIWVAAGVYKPTSGTDRNISFTMKNEVSIYGGFPNTGLPGFSNRNWSSNPTILSGDIGSTDNNVDNSYHVIHNYFNSLDHSAILDGFTITKGNAGPIGISPEINGGGVSNQGSSPTFKNCLFIDNYAGFSGGGMYNNNASPILSNCIFAENISGYGGAGLANSNGFPVINNCLFTGNSAGTNGGGILNTNNVGATISQCIFKENRARSGAGICDEDGSDLTVTTISECLFQGNSAFESGGAMLNYLNANPLVSNCIFSGNMSSFQGGAIFNAGSTAVFINSSFSGNRGAGVIFNNSSSTIIFNCIIWGNSSGVHNFGENNNIVSFSIVQGGYSGEGNLNVNPLFVNQPPVGLGTSGDLRLLACSPAINAGNNGAVPMDLTTDLDGNTRIFGGTVDMGAYEFQSTPTPLVASCQNQNVILDGSGDATFSASLLNSGSSGCGTLSFAVGGQSDLLFECADLGANEVTLTVTDSNGQSATCSAIISVSDNTPPSFTCPANQDIHLNAACQILVPDLIDGLTATDNCGIVSFLQNPSAGSAISSSHNGTVIVTITASDGNGNSADCEVILTARDITPPSISCQSNLMVNTDPDQCSAVVHYNDPIGIDNCSGATTTRIEGPVSGTAFPAGMTTIAFSVSDLAGNTGSCTFNVTVTDNEQPDVQCFNHSIIFNGENSISLAENALADADDNCGIQSISLSPNSISSSQVGQTVPVLVTVTDINSNTSVCTSLITVGGLPSGWSQNINGVGCSNGNDIEYNAATQIWTATSTNCYYSSPFTSDAMAFAQRTLCGNGSITAQVTGISGTALGWAGVIMRESNAVGAKKAQLTTNMAGNQSRREFRVSTNGTAMPQQFPAQNRFWLRVVRSGNQFIMYNSPNGVQWFQIGAQNVAMGSCIEIGLVATNYNSNSTVTATFANVSYSGNGPMLQASGPDNFNLIAEGNIQPDFSVYPNPTSGELNIDLRAYIGKKVQVELYSSEGKLMQLIQSDEILQSTQTILMDGYSAGMYFVKLKSKSLPDVTRRVVLMREGIY